MKKKLIGIITILSFISFYKKELMSTVTVIRDASNITRGTLDDARLGLSNGQKVITIASGTFAGTVTSTSGFVGVFTGVVSATNSLNTSPSTQTKTGGLVLNGAQVIDGYLNVGTFGTTPPTGGIGRVAFSSSLYLGDRAVAGATINTDDGMTFAIDGDNDTTGASYDFFKDATNGGGVLLARIEERGFLVTMGSVAVGNINQVPQAMLDVYDGSVSIKGSPVDAARQGLEVVRGTTSLGSGITRIRGVTYIWPTGDGTSGQVIKTDGSGNLSWNNDASIGVAVTTFTKTIAVGGPVFIASATFNSIPGKAFTVGKTTMNVFEMRAYVSRKSTVTAGTQYVYCRIAESTGMAQGVADNFNSFRYVSPTVEISTQNSFSLWYTTAFPMYPQNQYTLHITSIPTSGTLPEDLKVEMSFWRSPY